MPKTRMKVFTSPWLRRSKGRLTMVCGGQHALCLAAIKGFVDLPRTRYYDVQVSLTQWADQSGVETRLEHRAGFISPCWVWTAIGVHGGLFYGPAARVLAGWFPERYDRFTIFWRVRYWS